VSGGLGLLLNSYVMGILFSASAQISELYNTFREEFFNTVYKILQLL
jgi:hypothetical protein